MKQRSGWEQPTQNKGCQQHKGTFVAPETISCTILSQWSGHSTGLWNKMTLNLKTVICRVKQLIMYCPLKYSLLITFTFLPFICRFFFLNKISPAVMWTSVPITSSLQTPKISRLKTYCRNPDYNAFFQLTSSCITLICPNTPLQHVGALLDNGCLFYIVRWFIRH